MTAPEAPLLLQACCGRPVRRPPVWFMRQAGRSLPEYRRARGDVPMLESCMRPDLVTEITLQPVRRYGVDAAILYSDIVLPLRVVGVDVDIVPGTGPVIGTPVRSAADLDRLRVPEPGELAFLDEAVRLLVAELGPTPLIGFAGAPYTLASYLVEGGPSRERHRTRALMYGDPALWVALLDRLAAIAVAFLQVQVAAGARAVQLFDSWVGDLAEPDYRRSVLPASRAVLAALGETEAPRIHFGVGTGELLAVMAEAGADVVGVDWRVPLDAASARVGGHVAVQGNLDPALLQAPDDVLAAAVAEVVRRGRTAPGHVFNLGHGVPPDTDPGRLARVVDLVHACAS